MGDVLRLLGYGPVEADGYTWFMFVRFKGLRDSLPALPALAPNPEGDLTGWIAVGGASDAFVAALPARCPTTLDLASIEGMLPGEQLVCLGSRALTLEGTYGCDGCGGTNPGEYVPQWLAYPESWDFLSVSVQDGPGSFALRFPPDVPRPPAASVIRVRGHFDDARAATCSISVSSSDDGPLGSLPADQASLYCRQQFVVTDYDVLGIDPSFPPQP